MGKTRDLFKKIRDTKGTYHAKVGIIRDRNSKELTDIDYTEEVTNRFKGLDLIDRVPEELWTEVFDIVQKAVIKNIPI